MRTTPGSWASPTTSPSRFGSVDNADGKRRTLGGGSTGGGVAVPIFEPAMQAVWANVAPKAALAPPSPEAKRQLACKSVDLDSGEKSTGGGKEITECFRVDAKGKVLDTQYLLVSRKTDYAKRDKDDRPPKKPQVARASSTGVRASYWSNDPWRASQQWNWQSQYELALACGKEATNLVLGGWR
jgi:hypothetical protein